MPTVHAGRDMDGIERQADERLPLVLERVARTMHALCASDGLHPVQWSALRYFAGSDPRERTVSGLARHLGVTQPPASRTVATLVERGWLSAARDDGDRRSKIVSLTAEGEAVLREDPIVRIRRLLSDMERDHPGLGTVLDELSRRLAAEARTARGPRG